MSERFKWLRSAPAELKMLLALLAILAASYLFSLVSSRLEHVGTRLRETFGWVVGIGIGLALLCSAWAWLRARRRRGFGRELELHTVGPTRREEAEREREYKRKWLRGIEQLKQSGKSLYDLPWYVIIGEPAGGKTMTLINSGMDFPLGKEELPGFGGTRNYNWWFTNDAVILDTAGRLVFEQEGTTDKREWEEFLRTLRNRRRCPINGVVVGLPADKLMKDPPEQRQQAATVLRDRLRQMQQVLGVRFPVYLLITKMDLVAGFTEFFGQLDALQRNQIFGWSRPGPFESGYDPHEFAVHFDELRRRLEELRLRFLVSGAALTGDSAAAGAAHAPLATHTPANERAWIYTFPEAFAALHERLQDYVNVIFSRNVFAEPLFFRGFYFTSALQEGKPILELLGSRLAKEDLQDLKDLYPQSRAYFIYDFYTRKVAPEQGLVFRSAKQLRRSRRLRLVTYRILLPGLVVMLAAFALGYFQLSGALERPRKHADDAVSRIQRVSKAGDFLETSKVTRLLADLADDEQSVQHGGRWGGWLLVQDTGAIASDLSAVRRELFGHTLLRARVLEIEKALAEPDAPGRIGFGVFRAALLEYLEWSSGQKRRPDASFAHMDAVLDRSREKEDPFSEQLRQFEDQLDGDVRGAFARWSDAPESSVGAALRAADAYGRGKLDAVAESHKQHWARVREECAAVLARYPQILAAGEPFATAGSLADWNAAATGWDDACRSARSGDPRGGADCGTRLFAALEEALRQRAANPALAGPPGERQLETVEGEVGRFWHPVVELSGAARVPGNERVAKLAGELSSAFAARVAEVKSGAANPLRDYAAVLAWDGAAPALSAPARQAREALNALDGLIHQSLVPSAGGGRDQLQAWIDTARELSAAAKTPSACDELPAEEAWRPSNLRTACAAIVQAQARARRAALLRAIPETLGQAASATAPLSASVSGAEQPAGPGALRQRDQAEFLVEVMRRKLELTTALGALDPALAPQGPGDAGDPAAALAKLDEAMSEYLTQYYRDWAQEYKDGFRQKPVFAALARRRDNRWSDVVKAFPPRRDAEPRDPLWEDYRQRVASLERNLVAPIAAPPATDAALRVSESLKAAARVDEHQPLSRWLRARLDGAPPADLEAGEDAWAAFTDLMRLLPAERLTLDHFEKLERPLPRIDTALHGRAAPAGADGPAPIPADDYLAAHLQWIVDVSAWALHGEVDTALKSTLKRFGDPAPFPFERGRPTKDREVIRGLLDSLAVLAAFVERLEAGGVLPLAADDPRTKRDRLLRQAKEWSDVLGRETVQLSIAYNPAPDGVQKDYAKLVFECHNLSKHERPCDAVELKTAEVFNETYQWQPQSLISIRLTDPVGSPDSRSGAPPGANDFPLLARTAGDLALFWFLSSVCVPVDGDAGAPAARPSAFRKTWAVPLRDQTRTLTLELRLTHADKQPLALPPLLPADGSFTEPPCPAPPWSAPGDAGR